MNGARLSSKQDRLLDMVIEEPERCGTPGEAKQVGLTGLGCIAPTCCMHLDAGLHALAAVGHQTTRMCLT